MARDLCLAMRVGPLALVERVSELDSYIQSRCEICVSLTKGRNVQEKSWCCTKTSSQYSTEVHSMIEELTGFWKNS